MNKKKIEKITELFAKLYCFTPKQVATYMKRIPYMAEEGLNKLIKTLEAGLKEQNKMIKTWIKREPEFANRLTKFVDKTANDLTKEYEKEEKVSAEKILAELD